MVENVATILGASGFIGTRLVDHLARQGFRVRAVDIAPPRVRIDGVSYFDADVREPLDHEIGDGAGVLYNLAAVHRTPGHPPHEYHETNVQGALNATALAEACGIETVLFTSSISVYGPCENTVREVSPLKPTSDYGRSKRMAEMIFRAWRQRDVTRKLVIVRPGVVFGPGERGNYSHLAKALRGGYFVYPGRRDTIKSGGHVDELLSTMAFALQHADQDVLYNFAFPDFSTTQDIVETFGRVTGRRRRPMVAPIWPLKLAAIPFEFANDLGAPNPIHRDRVMKLVQSTKVEPAWLKAQGYQFGLNLERALESWRDETQGRFE